VLKVLRAGFLSTVQDLGRPGCRQFGVGTCGAVDTLALTLGNRLVGNAANTAGLEITVGPTVQFSFECDSVIAMTGADVVAELDGTPVWPGWRTPARRGQTLTLGTPRSGLRAYLALAGGIDVPVVLGSRSTDLNAGFGGFHHRALQNGDRLPLGNHDGVSTPLGIKLPEWVPWVRALPGPEYEEFMLESRQQFWDTSWQASPQSNRMGYRLVGPTLVRASSRELLSHAVLPGVVQVPPNGQPIALLADAQSTGGYPRIAKVIDADLWKLAQLPLGGRVRFIPCSLSDAHAAERQGQLYLERIGASLRDR
jgi:biotin-dependent carboxylase-like uncharacterized protein